MDDDNLNLPPWLLCDGLKNSLVGIIQLPTVEGLNSDWSKQAGVGINLTNHDSNKQSWLAVFFSLFSKFWKILYTLVKSELLWREKSICNPKKC